MSEIARDLIEMLAFAASQAVTQEAIRQTAMNIIAPGVADLRGGC
ncbi:MULTISPECIES: hypothetical protein [unclassified Caballeronia]|nr:MULTISPECIES: hypothetical protein [unclassified Caballeronia]